ncbi:MAG: transcriptional regulator [Psychrobacillus sp.]
MIDQLMSPKQASDFLSVKANALKKYALLLEKNGYNVSRNELNYRMYNGQDIAMIRAMLILNRVKSVQLEDAASIVTSSDTNIADILAMDDTHTDVHNDGHTDVLAVTQSQVPAVPTHVADLITSLQKELQVRDTLYTDFMAAIDDKLSEQTTMIQQLSEQNESLLARLEEMERKQESDNRKSLWAKLFGK